MRTLVVWLGAVLLASACSVSAADVAVSPVAAAPGEVEVEREAAAGWVAPAEPADALETFEQTISTQQREEPHEATASAQEPEVPGPRSPERQAKDNRRDAYDAMRAEQFALFHAGPPPLETEYLPDPELLSESESGSTLRITTTVDHASVSGQPTTLTTFANNDTGYVHTIADQAAYAELNHAQRSQTSSLETPPGTLETVQFADSHSGGWSRGYTGATSHASHDPDTWYASGALGGVVTPDFAFQTEAEVWALLEQPLPPQIRDRTGALVRTATLEGTARTWQFGRAAWTSPDETVTLLTRAGESGLIDELEVNVQGPRPLTRIVMTVDERGAPLVVPAIVGVRQSPTSLVTHISAKEYSWTATGTATDTTGAVSGRPWNADGRLHDGRYPESTLSMTAHSIEVLSGIALTQTPPDQMVRRHGYRSVSYTTGMYPELAPYWAEPDVDPKAHYIHDPFNVPADLFADGLSDEDQWLSLRSVPQIVTLDGWDFARVTQGNVDPEYWNYRGRLGDGFFAWIVSEDDREVFEVTIGADENGRMHRFQIQTTDIDGSGLLLVIDIDEETKPYLDLPNDSPASQLRTSTAWAEEAAASEALAPTSFDERLETFIAASREQWPVFDHARRPEHLTLLTVRVKDEPSGAYEPDGEYFRWPSVYFRHEIEARVELDAYPGEKVDVVCLELEDNQWRYSDNTFERFWRGFEDGGQLDDLILRYNANAWLQVDLYATDGERHADDPCRWLSEQ